jgi:hypothetical protein
MKPDINKANARANERALKSMRITSSHAAQQMSLTI